MIPYAIYAKKENETTLHGLVTCLEVKKVWFASPLSMRIDEDENCLGDRNLLETLLKLSSLNFGSFISLVSS